MENMFKSELQKRNYSNESHIPKLYSLDPIMIKFIYVIKNNDNFEFESLFKQYGNFNDGNIDVLKAIILDDNFTFLEIILEYLDYKLDNDDILAFACQVSGMSNIIKELLKCRNININAKGGSNNETPLNYLLMDPQNDLINIFLEFNDIDLSIQDINGNTPLQNTIINKKYDIASLLINHKNIKLNNNDINLIFSKGNDSTIINLINIIKDNNYNFNDYFIEVVKRYDISINVLKSLIQYIDINYIDSHKHTAIMYTAILDYVEKLNFILKVKNVDITLTNCIGMNALMLSIKNNNYLCTNLLINYINTFSPENKNIIINQCNFSMESAINIAAKQQDINSFKLLYTLQPNINYKNIFGFTPLLYAIKYDNNDIFELLIDIDDLDINCQDLDGLTPLMYAIKKNNNNFIYKLLEHKNIDLNLMDNRGKNVLGFTIDLLLAIKNKRNLDFVEPPKDYANYPQCFNDLLDISSYDDKINSIFNLIMILLSKDIDVNTFDIYNKNCLIYAIENKISELFTLIINSKNFDHNLQNYMGKTYLMIIFDLFINNNNNKVLDEKFNVNNNDNYNNNNDIYLNYFIQLTNQSKINLNSIDFVGNTILSYVCEKNNIIILDHLLKHNDININMKNYFEETPLMIAIKNKSLITIKKLLKYNVDININNDFIKHLNQSELLLFNKLIENNITMSNEIDKSNITKKGWFF